MWFGATGRYIEPLLDDFHAFCNFVEREKPLLTKKRAVLGKKEAFNLNARLYFKRELSAPNYQQEQYYCVDLLFALALPASCTAKQQTMAGRLA